MFVHVKRDERVRPREYGVILKTMYSYPAKIAREIIFFHLLWKSGCILVSLQGLATTKTHQIKLFVLYKTFF